jgi:ferredoxin-NADP reductase/MOSC domain-containing protein YiiM/ferredoxin
VSAKLISLNVGFPQDVSWHGKIVRTAVWKAPVAGPRKVHHLNIEGDGQGDLQGHGGPNRAVMVYQLDSYEYWQRELKRSDLVHGQFGENFTITGLLDTEVRIGDRYKIGTALFEISQPRVTCYRLGIRMDNPQMPSLLVAHHRPGFYFRVLAEGEVTAGDEIIKIAEGPEKLSVAEIDAMLYLGTRTPEKLNRALRISALSAGWKASFEALLNATPEAGNVGLTASSGPPPAWPGFRPLKVSKIQKESRSVISLTLVSADDRPLAAALPGQSIVLRIHPQSAGKPILRNYSLSDEPSAEHYRISVKQESNGVASTFIHQKIREGDQIEVAAPRGSFTLNSTDQPVVVLSAGVGATPVMAMLHALAAIKSPRQIWWLFGARNAEEHPFAEEARKLLSTLPNARSFIAYSRPNAQDHPGREFDSAGHITKEVFEKLAIPREADFYLCGPQGFVQDLTAGLAAYSVPNDRIHSETFGPAPAITPGIAAAPKIAPDRPRHQPTNVPDTGPQVSFARSNLTVTWDEKYPSLLDLAEACDLPVRWSCRTGVCHTCETPLISGEVIYEPDPLDPPPPATTLICCARPTTDLTLDL